GGSVQSDFSISLQSHAVLFRAHAEATQIDELFVTDFGASQARFSAGTATVAENAGAANLTVNIAPGALVTVTVGYAVSGGSAPAADYSLPAGTLAFAPGETSKTIPVTINDNATLESSRTVVVTLNGGSAQIGAPSTLTLTITDNEQAATATP